MRNKPTFKRHVVIKAINELVPLMVLAQELDGTVQAVEWLSGPFLFVFVFDTPTKRRRFNSFVREVLGVS